MNFLCEPYLLTHDPAREMYILWYQREKMEGCVEYGADPSLGKRLTAQCYEIVGLRTPRADGTYTNIPTDHPTVPVWQYIAKITDLTAGDKVFYRCSDGTTHTKIYDFNAGVKAGDDFTFAQLSDLQGLGECHKTVHKIGCMHPDFLLFSGDATFYSWRLDQWFDTGEEWQSEESKKSAFFPCMQQENGARLMQYAPTFLCPGNHELDDMRCDHRREYGDIDEMWNWSVFMQMFRPLYPDTDTSLTGTRWYSAQFGDMHIVSLNVNRFPGWNHWEYPGLRIYDSIEPDSPQYRWLEEDLSADRSTFKWVIQHFHLLNKGGDVQYNFCQPVIDEDGNATYPHDYGSVLMDLFSAYGVNAVTYGHSHVYERYFRKSTHFIEAAYLSVTFRGDNAPPHPSGLLPIVEDNSQRSFLIVKRQAGGLFATGYYAQDPPVAFDTYPIADENGVTVAPV